MEGKVVIFSAPSGSGKTTIVKELLKYFENIEFSISATSRQKRENEINGVDYHFLSADEFRSSIDEGNFVEWEEVYTDCYYGTLQSEVERIWKKGNHVIFDVDVLGGINLKKQYTEKALAVFIKTPSIEELERRLRGRNTETEASFNKRMERALLELSHSDKFDVVIVNDVLDDAIIKAKSLLNDFFTK